MAEEQTRREMCVSLFEQSCVCIHFPAHCPDTLLQPGTNGDTVLQIKIKRLQSCEIYSKNFLH